MHGTFNARGIRYDTRPLACRHINEDALGNVLFLQLGFLKITAANVQMLMGIAWVMAQDLTLTQRQRKEEEEEERNERRKNVFPQRDSTLTQAGCHGDQRDFHRISFCRHGYHKVLDRRRFLFSRCYWMIVLYFVLIGVLETEASFLQKLLCMGGKKNT